MDNSDHAPFGHYAPPRWLAKAVQHGNTHANPVIKYLNKKLAVRFLKFVSRPFDIELDGVKFRLYPKDNLHDRIAMRSGRSPDHDWYDILFSPIRENGTFVDIGANVGFFAVVARARRIPDLKILAIEPHPLMRDRLETNLALNSADDVVVESVAVGSEVSTMTLHQPSKNNSGVTTLHPDGAAKSRADFQVEVKPLLTILADHEIQSIDLLKIDIEGYEDRALVPFFDNAAPSLWPRSVFIEHNSRDRWDVDILDKMTRIGYVLVEQDKKNALFNLKA